MKYKWVAEYLLTRRHSVWRGLGVFSTLRAARAAVALARTQREYYTIRIRKNT